MHHYFAKWFGCTASIIKLIPCVAAFAVLSACALTKDSAVETLSLPADQLSIALSDAAGQRWPAGWQVEQIDNNPYLYKIRPGKSSFEHGPAFATAIKDCDAPKSAGADATTRQLLVGMTDIEILHEEDFAYDNNRIFYKQIAAVLDDTPLKLLTFTARNGRCVQDAVIWSDDVGSGSLIDRLSKLDNTEIRKIYFALSNSES